MTGSTLLVVNPWATKTTTDMRMRATRALAGGGLVDVVVTHGPGEARTRIAEAMGEGAVAVASLGGDGTLAEVASTLADSEGVVIPLPGGSTNVFARAIGWPSSLSRALAELPAALAEGRTARVRLGHVTAGENERVFVMNAGVGVDAETVHWVEGHPGLKRRLRQASFILGASRVGVRYARRPPAIDVSVDDEPPLRVAALVATCGSPYTFLGPRPIDLVPGAHFDGPVAWRALTHASISGLSSVLARTVLGQGPREHGALVGGIARRSLVLHATPPTAVQADGEPLGWHPRVTIRPGPLLRVLLPRRPLVPAEA